MQVRPGRPGWAEVTFRHPCATDDVAVIGEFNGWAPQRLSSEDDADGRRSLTVEIPVGCAYQFRYLVGGRIWENDWQADDYVPNAFGGEDSVLDLRPDGPHGRSLGPDASDELPAEMGRAAP